MNAILIMAVALAVAGPAQAVTNLIKNGSFEQGAPGVGGFVQWTKQNIPDNSPASIISYSNNEPYPLGAFGESVSPDNAISASPDAVGNQAAYFAGDLSQNEAISQLTYLNPGNFRVGFSYYLPSNGLGNAGDSRFEVTILGIPVATTNITSASPGQTWLFASGVGQISAAGWYDTAFVFNSNLAPSKDIVIDRVFAIRTLDEATVIIPATLGMVPEPATWAMLVLGFGLVGATLRGRNRGMVKSTLA